jgi:hypothetical protein
MYLEVHWKLALAVVLAVLLWPYRPLLVRKAAIGASLFEEVARGASRKRSDYAAAS